MRDDWITVVPDADKVKAVAAQLLALARSPHDVRTTGTGTEFRIPPYLADLYSAPPKRRRAPKKEEGEE